ncbi:hypothetical protein KCU92_g298, partial [Aureobasidium melanogenum]
MNPPKDSESESETESEDSESSGADVNTLDSFMMRRGRRRRLGGELMLVSRIGGGACPASGLLMGVACSGTCSNGVGAGRIAGAATDADAAVDGIRRDLGTNFGPCGRPPDRGFFLACLAASSETRSAAVSPATLSLSAFAFPRRRSLMVSAFSV